MTATLSQTQIDLPKLVELASRGEEVVITVDGQPKAKLIRANATLAAPTPVNVEDWLITLAELRAKYSTGSSKPTVEDILAEDRADRV